MFEFQGRDCPADHRPQVMVPEPTPLAVRYYRSGNGLWVMDTAFGLLLPALILATGFSARMRDWTFRMGKRWLPSVALYALVFTVIAALVTLPLSFYEGFVRQHEYGLSNQTLRKWLSDWVKGVAVSGVGLALVLWVPYLLLRRSPRRWWLYSGLATIPIAALVMVVVPIWVDPLFNRFSRLQDQQLEQRILQLADRAGISQSRVYQVNKSVDTKTVNAYVTGLGGTKRIVLWDTSLRKLSPDQIAFVVGHEMGHFVLRHVLWFIVVATLSVTAALFLVDRVAHSLIRRFSGRFGFSELSDVASFPLFLLVAGGLSFVAGPLVLAFSRHQEHEADRFALELTQNNQAAARTFLRLQEENLAVPRPGRLHLIWRASHPPLGDRVDFANRYRPWECGFPLRYGRLFH